MVQGSFIGRESELGQAGAAFDSAIAGKGSALVVSGEPGIGKTRFVEACINLARERGMEVLVGSASQESPGPFHVFSRALSGLPGASLLEAADSVSFSGVFLVSGSGGIAAQAMNTEMDPKRIAATLEAVQSFVSDSFRGAEGGIGRMTFGNMTILAERLGEYTALAVIEGEEHPDMAARLRSAAGEAVAVGPEAAVAGAASLKFSVRKDLAGVKLSSERNRLADRTLDVLRAAAGNSPVLMVFEDMHWSDEISLFVFSYLSGQGVPQAQAVSACHRQAVGKLGLGQPAGKPGG